MITLDGRTISIHKGNSGSIAFSMYKKDRTKFSLNGCTVTFMVKRSKKDPDSAAVIVVGPTTFDDSVYIYKEVTVVDPKTGESHKETKVDLKHAISVFLSSEATNIPHGYYHWALRIKKDGYVNEAASGQFYIVDSIIDGDLDE